MNRNINQNRSFILSIICIIFIVFTIVFISVLSLKSNGLIKSDKDFIISKINNYYGNSLHGYIELSPLWSLKKNDNPNDNSLHFKSTDGYLLTMSAFDSSKIKSYDLANNIYSNIKNKEYTAIQLDNERINGYVAYKVVGFDMKVAKWVYTWVFEDNNNITHSISIEGNNKNSSSFKIPFSYKVFK